MSKYTHSKPRCQICLHPKGKRIMHSTKKPCSCECHKEKAGES